MPGGCESPGLPANRVRRRPTSSARRWVTNQGGLGKREKRPFARQRGKGSEGAYRPRSAQACRTGAHCAPRPGRSGCHRRHGRGRHPTSPAAREKQHQPSRLHRWSRIEGRRWLSQNPARAQMDLIDHWMSDEAGPTSAPP
jgi:hypothetical protein